MPGSASRSVAATGTTIIDMKPRTVAKVIVDSKGRLFLVPDLEADATSYEYIYREANGLRWDRTTHAFHAYEPERWDHVELLHHIASTLRSAYDEDLRFTDKTVWEGIHDELRPRLRAALP